MTENTSASGAADLHAMLRSAADNIAYAIDNLSGMTLDELPPGMLDSTAAAESGLLAERTIREVMEALAASAPVSPTLETEAVRWEFRWLNPANNPCSSPSEMAWKLVAPKGMQPLEAALSDLRACRYAGKPCYEVRPLFAQAAPVAPVAPVAPAPQPAPFNLRTQWLTVVYRGVEAGDEARVICEHPKVSAMSWSHALDDRDDAIAAAPKAAPAPSQYGSPELQALILAKCAEKPAAPKE